MGRKQNLRHCGIYLLLTFTVSVGILGRVTCQEYESDNYEGSEYSSESDAASDVDSAPKDSGFVTPLDFSPLFSDGVYGLSAAPASPVVNVIEILPKSNAPVVFNSPAQGSSIFDPLASASEKIFSPETFGFIPQASQGYQPPPTALQLQLHPQNPQQYQQNILEIERNKGVLRSVGLTHAPYTQYNVQTQHDPNYKVYISGDTKNGAILEALRKNPSVAAYFQPQASNVDIKYPVTSNTKEDGNPQKYKLQSKIDSYPSNYGSIANNQGKNYLADSDSSPHRIRRYTDGRRRKESRKSSDSNEDDSPYNYRADYTSRPKEYDSSPYSNNYKELEKDDKDNYDYGSDSGYNFDDYERIKALSDKQAAEIKQNPENCKEVKKDSMTCMVCTNPKDGGNYESCAYVSEPKNNKYAYVKNQKFDSNDAPENENNAHKTKDTPANAAKYQAPKAKQNSPRGPKSASIKAASSTPVRRETSDYFKGYKPEPYKAFKPESSEQKYEKYSYPTTSNPNSKPYSSYTVAEDDEEDDENSKEKVKTYDYKGAIPGFYTDNEEKKDVEHVLAEFRKKDRSACNKVHKNGMTCYQCVDKNGLKHEECMFVSESAPKRSHLAYQELKEFTSKPETLKQESNEEAESQVVTTNPALANPAESASSVVLSDSYGQKLKRKKVASGLHTTTPTTHLSLKQPTLAPASTQASAPSRSRSTVGISPLKARIAKRSDRSHEDYKVEIPDETNLAPPREFAGDASKGAFWQDTVPRFSRSLGVSLPQYMVERSEHEKYFDEAVTGG